MSYPCTIGGLFALVVCSIDYFAIEPFVFCVILISIAFAIETIASINRWVTAGFQEVEDSLSKLH